MLKAKAAAAAVPDQQLKASQSQTTLSVTGNECLIRLGLQLWLSCCIQSLTWRQTVTQLEQRH